MKVLVIGATGFVGGAIARHLKRDGHIVAGTARTDGAAQRLRENGIDAVRCDLDDHLDVALAAACDADATVFAAQLSPDHELAVVTGLLEAISGMHKAFAFVSGSGVLMQRTAGSWSEDTYAEDDPFEPEPLALSRVTTESAVRSAAARAELRAMVIRPPYLWGDGEHGHLAALYRSFAATGTVCYVGEGLNCYSHLHVEDAARLVGAALSTGQPGALYHGVAGEIPNRWLAEAVAADLGGTTRSITIDEAASLWGEFDALIMGACSRIRAPRAHRDLGWQPRHTDIMTAIGAPHLRAIGRCTDEKER